MGGTVVRGDHDICLTISRAGFNHGTVIGLNGVDRLRVVVASRRPPRRVITVLGSGRVPCRIVSGWLSLLAGGQSLVLVGVESFLCVRRDGYSGSGV